MFLVVNVTFFIVWKYFFFGVNLSKGIFKDGDVVVVFLSVEMYGVDGLLEFYGSLKWIIV